MYKIAISAIHVMSNPGIIHTYARTSHTQGEDPGFGCGRASRGIGMEAPRVRGGTW